MAREAAPQPNTTPAEVMRALDEVAQNGRRRVVRAHGKAVALVPQASRPRSRRKVFTQDDPLWGIVGLIQDDGPTDVSDNVDKYLAEAYLDTHE